MTERDDELDQYHVETFVRRVTSVLDAGMRRRQIQRHLLTVDAATAAGHLQQVLADAIRGSGPAREVMTAFAEFCLTLEPRETLALEAINLVARTENLHGVGWLLLDPEPARRIDPARLRRDRAPTVTLGERRAQAAGWDPRVLERLSRDSEPLVIERLCANTRLSEPLLLSIATRRPIAPELLTIIARHARWYIRPVVREALVQNPYGPTGLALRTLPLLSQPVIERVVHSSELHPAVRGFATYLLRLRRGETDGPAPGYDQKPSLVDGDQDTSTDEKGPA